MGFFTNTSFWYRSYKAVKREIKIFDSNICKILPACWAQSRILVTLVPIELEQFVRFARPSTPIVPNCALTPHKKAVAVAAESGVWWSILYLNYFI